MGSTNVEQMPSDVVEVVICPDFITPGEKIFLCKAFDLAARPACKYVMIWLD